MSALSFASPGLAVAAGAAVAVPIAIHLLLRRRRSPVEWAAMDLLREALRRVDRKRRVERWLLLAVRCLVVACAGFAIAAPFIGTDATGIRSARTLVVVIDDSAASNERLGTEGGGGTAFERSVAAAKAAIEALAPGDRVALVPASRPASVSRDAASLDHRGALQRLTSMGATESACDIPAAMEAASMVLSNEESTGTLKELLLASAFRAGSVGAMPPLPKMGNDGAEVSIAATNPPAAQGANLQVTGVEAERLAGTGPDAPASLRITVRRDRGDGPLKTTVRVAGPTMTAPVERVLELGAGERERSTSVTITERPADPSSTLRRAVVVSISPDSQPVDDARATVLAPTDRLRVAVVDRRSFDAASALDRLPAGDWVARALAPGEPATIDVTQVDPVALDARTAAVSDAIVIAEPQLLNVGQWTMLASFVARGGMVAVLPAAGERVQAWTGQLASTFGIPWKMGIEARERAEPTALAGEQPGSSYLAALSGELPQLAPAVDVFRSVDVDASVDPGAVQLTLQDGTAFLLSWRPADARGTVMLFTSAIDLGWTTLPLKPLMVPLWQEMVAEGRRRASTAQVASVGSQPEVDRQGVVELRPVSPDGASMPGVRTVPVGAGGRTSMPLERGGLLEMLDSGGRPQGMLAAVIDGSVTSVAPTDQERVRGWLASAGTFTWIADAGSTTGSGEPTATAPAARSNGSLAPALFAAALLLAVVEAFLARRFSHAVKSGGILRNQAHDVPRIASGGSR